MLIKAYEGVVRQNTGAYFGFDGETFGYAFALITIPALAVSYNYGKIARRLKHAAESVYLAMYALGFMIVFLTDNLALGIISFTSIYMAQELAKPYITSLVNKNTDSRHRATALSTVSLMSELPYMVLVIFFGSFIEVDSIRYLYLIFTITLFIYIIVRKAPKRS